MGLYTMDMSLGCGMVFENRGRRGGGVSDATLMTRARRVLADDDVVLHLTGICLL
jgi:hypothetical protein